MHPVQKVSLEPCAELLKFIRHLSLSITLLLVVTERVWVCDCVPHVTAPRSGSHSQPGRKQWCVPRSPSDECVVTRLEHESLPVIQLGSPNSYPDSCHSSTSRQTHRYVSKRAVLLTAVFGEALRRLQEVLL